MITIGSVFGFDSAVGLIIAVLIIGLKSIINSNNSNANSNSSSNLIVHITIDTHNKYKITYKRKSQKCNSIQHQIKIKEPITS